MPANIRFLHEILGIGARAEHPVCEAEETPPHRLEGGQRNSVDVHISILQHLRRTTLVVVTALPSPGPRFGHATGVLRIHGLTPAIAITSPESIAGF